MSRYGELSGSISSRSKGAIFLVCCAFLLLAVRLWYLQILNGDYFRNRSENNRIRRIYVPAPRGIVTDKEGVVIAENRPAFDVELIVEDSPQPKETAISLAKILGLDAGEILSRLMHQPKRRRFEPKLLVRDVNRDVVARVAARRPLLPGIVISAEPAREYPFGEEAAHVLGYIREITRDQLENLKYAGYRAGDLIGQYGIEALWENRLRGRPGTQDVIVNAVGTRIGESSFEPEIAGSQLMLTLDMRVQNAAEFALGERSGAVVALEAKTGRVLALVSKPAFNPNDFVGEMSSDTWRDLILGPGRRLNNRAVQGTFPPGSIFKFIVLYAALAEHIISPNEEIFCPGYLNFGGRRFRCHKHAGHGKVNAHRALVDSCDVYFYVVGQRLGIDRIARYASMFGLGEATGLSLVEEAAGIVPSTEWKARTFSKPEDKRWYPGETLSVSIGQGALTVTPLQMAYSLAAFVNGGALLKPQIVERMTSSDGVISDDVFKRTVQRQIELDKSAARIVRDALVGVVNDPGGTGRRAQLPAEMGIVVGGKTGTAQVASLELGKKDEKHQDHAWFVSFAPAENPEIVVTVLVENGGGGGANAAPVAKEVLQSYFRPIPLAPPGDGAKR